MEYWQNLSLIGIIFILSFLIGLGMLLLPTILTWLKLNPKNPTSSKLAIYECGPLTIGETWVRFNFRYYFYALLFLLFDIEVVFFYPWAVVYNKQVLFLLIEMLIFIAILMVGLIYAWRKGDLGWK